MSLPLDHMDGSLDIVRRLIDVSLQELDFQLSKGRRSLLVAKKQKYLRTVTGSLLYQVSLLLGVMIIKGHFTTNHSGAHSLTTNFPLCSSSNYDSIIASNDFFELSRLRPPTGRVHGPHWPTQPMLSDKPSKKPLMTLKVLQALMHLRI